MTKKKPPNLLVPPTGFYSTARCNLGGAKRIASTFSAESERNRNSCIQFLLGWAAEGYLKTYLANAGMSEHDLRVCIGHDLDEALRIGRGMGLVVTGAEQLDFVVSHLAPAHLSMFWRYLPTNVDGTERKFDLVMPSVAFPALDMLDAAVWPGVQDEMNRLLAAQGRQPVPCWSATF